MTTVHLLSAGAAKGLVLALQPDFERASGLQLRQTFGAVGAMREQLDAGAPCDADRADALDDRCAGAAGRTVADSVRDLGSGAHRRGGAAGRCGARGGRRGRAACRCCRAASAIYLPDPERATAGIHALKVLRGPGEEVAPRLRPLANGAAAMAAMARAADAASVGITQVSEILYTPGLQLLGALPPPFALATLYSVAVVAGSAQRAGAVELQRRLTGAAAATLRRDGGFEPC